MIFGSLFSGIGGIDLGLERAGMRCGWQVEIDDYANCVLEKHWPNVERHRDVRGVGAHNLARVDVIAGGFPCQDISVAGRGAGITGERSGLWTEFARIIRELRPRYVLVENVPALLSRGLGVVLGELASCGYDAEWDCLPASAFGAHHRRDRLFVVAYPSSELVRQQQRRSGGTSRPRAVEPRLDGASSDVADAESERCGSNIFEVGGRPFNSGWWSIEPDLDRMAHGVPKRVDRLRCLGNAVVPQVIEWIGRRIMERAA